METISFNCGSPGTFLTIFESQIPLLAVCLLPKQMFYNTQHIWVHHWLVLCTQSAHGSSCISHVSPQTQVHNSQASMNPDHSRKREDEKFLNFWFNSYQYYDQLKIMQYKKWSKLSIKRHTNWLFPKNLKHLSNWFQSIHLEFWWIIEYWGWKDPWMLYS